MSNKSYFEGYSYDGLLDNPYTDKAYYCYLVWDSERQKYYSGSRGVYGRSDHDLFSGYYSSSTVTDFVLRLIQNPEKFDYFVEYFSDRVEAFKAEAKFHKLHSVASSKIFYNSQNCGDNQNCGAGSTLCVDENGNIFRVSSEEYKTGKYVHCCKGRMLVHLKNVPNVIISIFKKDFDQEIHVTQFKNHVLCYDKLLNRTTKIPKEVFENEYHQRYTGITKGLVMALRLSTKDVIQVTKAVFDADDDLVGVTYGKFPVINLLTDEKEHIHRDQYDEKIYRHPNKNITVQFSLVEKKNVTIEKNVYERNKHQYANQTTKEFILHDGWLFRSLYDFRGYARKYLNLIIRSQMTHARKKCPWLVTITKEEYIKGDERYEIYKEN